MTLAAILLAQLAIGEAALWVVRLAAGIGGAFLGWFISDPLARVLYRLAFQKPVPPWAVPWAKIAGAMVVGLLVFFLIPLGGGPGGLGYGPGLGGGPGKGPGDGGGKEGSAVAPNGDKKADDKKPAINDDKVKPPEKPVIPSTRTMIEIEVLGGKRYPGGERYYLLRPEKHTMTLTEIEAYFKERNGKLELHVILTDDSPDRGQGIIEDLRKLADRYKVPTLEIRSP